MGRTVLVVDDSPTMRQMVGMTMRAAGFEVTEAVDGSHALEELAKRQFQLVITDLNMPNLDGISLIRETRKLQEYRCVPILMLTTESQEEKKQEGRSAGATGWLIKPFDPDKLMAVISKVVKLPAT